MMVTDADEPESRLSELAFFRNLFLLLTVMITWTILTAYIALAVPSSGIRFVPPSMPSQWGTIFLLPLFLQLIMAIVSLRTITDAVWMMIVFIYSAICTGLVAWSVACVLTSLVVFVPTQSGLSLGFYVWALFYEYLLLLVIGAFEFAVLAVLVPLSFWTESPLRRLQPAMRSRKDTNERIWIVLYAALIFVAVLFLYGIDTEPSSRLVLDFWPPTFGTTATTFWLLPQPFLYPLTLALLVVEHGPTELTIANIVFGVDVVAGIAALLSLISTIVALFNYVPTATPFTPVAAGVVLVLILSSIPFAINIIIGIAVWKTRTSIMKQE
jgi:hypothetical protein